METSTSATKEEQNRHNSVNSRRLQILNRHVQPRSPHASSITRVPCAGGVKGLPSFDPSMLETYLDDQRDLKKHVYDVFKYQPELLPRVGEALTKGELVLTA